MNLQRYGLASRSLEAAHAHLRDADRHFDRAAAHAQHSTNISATWAEAERKRGEEALRKAETAISQARGIFKVEEAVDG